jgi:glucose/mannose-6-phosphate isomerase
MERLDRSRMADLLRNFPRQVEDAIQIGENFSIPRTLRTKFEKIVFVGMGGSAIGGDVIRSLVASESPFPIFISRHYDLAPFVDSKTLCIFSSYSGNTEETLSAFLQGMKRRLKSVVITSGGELARLSERLSIPWIQIPKGLPPRSALGYSVFPILKLLSNLKLCQWDPSAVRELLTLLKALGEKKYAPEIPLRSNPAKRLAQNLRGRWVVIYAGTELLDSAALRFRNQIEENAKAMASHHLLPEMNHNEILGWEFPKTLIPKSACVFLRDPRDHPRIQLRMEFTRDLVRRRGAPAFEIRSEGRSRLARLFSVIFLGDWISFYLALLYGVDPTPVVVIESLKKQLAKTS